METNLERRREEVRAGELEWVCRILHEGILGEVRLPVSGKVLALNSTGAAVGQSRSVPA